MSAPRIFLPKIIKIGENLTKFCQKQICLVFLGHGVECVITANCRCKTQVLKLLK